MGAPGINKKRATVLSKDGLTDFMRSIICSEQETKEAFYVLDLGAVTTLMDRWTQALPTVQPCILCRQVQPEPEFPWCHGCSWYKF